MEEGRSGLGVTDTEELGSNKADAARAARFFGKA